MNSSFDGTVDLPVLEIESLEDIRAARNMRSVNPSNKAVILGIVCPNAAYWNNDLVVNHFLNPRQAARRKLFFKILSILDRQQPPYVFHVMRSNHIRKFPNTIECFVQITITLFFYDALFFVLLANRSSFRL